MKKVCLNFLEKSKINTFDYSIILYTIIGAFFSCIGIYTYNDSLNLAAGFMSSVLVPFFIFLLNFKKKFNDIKKSISLFIILVSICFIIGFLFSKLFKMNCKTDVDLKNNSQCRSTSNYVLSSIADIKNIFIFNLISGILCGIVFIYSIHSGLFLNKYLTLESISFWLSFNIAIIILPQIVKSGMLYEMFLKYKNKYLYNEALISIVIVLSNIIGLIIGAKIMSYIYKC